MRKFACTILFLLFFVMYANMAFAMSNVIDTTKNKVLSNGSSFGVPAEEVPIVKEQSVFEMYQDGTTDLYSNEYNSKAKVIKKSSIYNKDVKSVNYKNNENDTKYNSVDKTPRELRTALNNTFNGKAKVIDNIHN